MEGDDRPPTTTSLAPSCVPVAPSSAPSDVDLPEGGGQRRVAGLRREEVAQLAAISSDYYTRLEQGRIAPVQARARSTVARAAPRQRPAHLSERASRRARPVAPPGITEGEALPAAHPGPHRRSRDRHDPHHDILAWNPLAAALMVDFGDVPERERNFVRLPFTDPRMRSLYPDWEELARAVVSYLRMEAARKPTTPASPSSSANCPSETPHFASGGPAPTSRSSAAAPAGTTIPSSAKSRSSGMLSPPTPNPTSSSSSTPPSPAPDRKP